MSSDFRIILFSGYSKEAMAGCMSSDPNYCPMLSRDVINRLALRCSIKLEIPPTDFECALLLDPDGDDTNIAAVAAWLTEAFRTGVCRSREEALSELAKSLTRENLPVDY